MSEEPLAVHDVFKFMNDRNIIMSFLGDFTHTVITSLLGSLKKILDDSKMDFQHKKRFYAIVVECLDNISRHNISEVPNSPPLKNSSTIFTISEHDDCFKIQTGNYVFNSEIADLTARLEKVNSLDREGLKQLYREEILNKPEGGGLGIIDVSMRSGCKISYEFKKISDTVSFFVLQTMVSK